MKPSKSSRDWSFRIKDILQSIEKIEEYTKNMTFTDLKKNDLVIDAVVRNFEIIGEASNHVPLTLQHAHPHIPWRQMIGLRNLLIHEYFGVDVNAVWKTAHEDLPILKQQLLPLICDL